MGALGLVVNAIALWNTVYMQEVLAALSDRGESPEPADVARLSPLLHARVNLLGHYQFQLPAPIAAGQLRDVRLPAKPPPSAPR